MTRKPIPTKVIAKSPTKAPKRSPHCLFCYKLVHHDGHKDSKTIQTTKVKVCSQFYCHLASQTKSFTEKIQQRKDFEQLFEKNCGVCNDCFYVIEQQCKLFNDLERIKLVLQWQLEQFHNVVKCAGKVTSRLESFKESFHDDAGQYEKATQFRKNVIKFCTDKFKVPKSVVVLFPLKDKNTADVVPATGTMGNKDWPEAAYGNETESTVNAPGEKIFYMIKSEGEDEGNNGFTRIVTPPESVIETLCSGTCPTEGVSKNHYYYVEPHPEETPIPAPRPSTSGRFQCGKCPSKFISEMDLVCHVKTGTCFSKEGINLEVTGSTKIRPASGSKTLKRKLVEEENITPPLAKKSRQDNVKVNGTTGNVLSSSEQLVTKAINKLQKLNAPESAIVPASRRSTRSAKFSGQVRTEATNDFVESDSSLSASSHDEEEDIPFQNPKTNSPKKEVVKIKCPEDSCNKFFIMKSDLDNHMKHHYKFTCYFCPFQTNSVSTLVLHEIRNHPKIDVNGELLCPRCQITKVLSSLPQQQTSHYRKRHLLP